MSVIERDIAMAIRDCVDKTIGTRFTVMSGNVKAGSRDDNAMTVDVVLSVDDDDNPTPGVLLNAVTLDTNGMIMYPADGSNVWVAEIDGQGKYGIIKCSELVKMVVTVGGSKVTVTDGLVQFNDGELGGLAKTLLLQQELNKVKSILQHLLSVISGAPIPEPGSGANSALQVALNAAVIADELPDFSEIENTAIKQ